MVIFNTFFRIIFLYILQTINFLNEDIYLLCFNFLKTNTKISTSKGLFSISSYLFNDEKMWMNFIFKGGDSYMLYNLQEKIKIYI